MHLLSLCLCVWFCTLQTWTLSFACLAVYELYSFLFCVVLHFRCTLLFAANTICAVVFVLIDAKLLYIIILFLPGYNFVLYERTNEPLFFFAIHKSYQTWTPLLYTLL
jgi:hypothetical protein